MGNLKSTKMKYLLAICMVLMGAGAVGQSVDYNTKKGYIAEGYDVVAYFDNEAKEGDEAHQLEHGGVKFKFSSEKNLEKFRSNPEKYLPKYGGYCAYAVAVSGKKVTINPETYEIREGELYLFYNKGRTNTLELWNDESPGELKIKADQNWQKIMYR